MGGPAGTDRTTPALSRLGRGLWQARLIITVASLASMLLALGALWMTLVDLWRFFSTLLDYSGLEGAAAATARTELITDIVKVLDGFLLCAILVISSLGIFELFVGPVGAGEKRAQLLRVHDLDDLKERVARLVLLILMIELFGYALRIPYKTPLELMMLAGVVLLVALSIFLTANRWAHSAEPVERPSDPT